MERDNAAKADIYLADDVGIFAPSAIRYIGSSEAVLPFYPKTQQSLFGSSFADAIYPRFHSKVPLSYLTAVNKQTAPFRIA